jgi:hypothetical protein
MATGRTIADPDPGFSSPCISRDTGTILRHHAGKMDQPTVGMPAYAQSAF